MTDNNLMDYSLNDFSAVNSSGKWIIVPNDCKKVFQIWSLGHGLILMSTCPPHPTGVSQSAVSYPRTNSRQKSMCDESFSTLWFFSASLCLSSDAFSKVYGLQPLETGCQESDLVNSTNLRKMNTKSLCQGKVLGIRVRYFVHNFTALHF